MYTYIYRIYRRDSNDIIEKDSIYLYIYHIEGQLAAMSHTRIHVCTEINDCLYVYVHIQVIIVCTRMYTYRLSPLSVRVCTHIGNYCLYVYVHT